MKKLSLLFVACALLFVGCNKDPHFITDSQYRAQVHEDYEQRADLYYDLNLDTLNQAEREAMEFLYAYMPYSDLADYEPEFFLNQVRYAFMARENMSWGKNVPEDIFRHFVLVYRVNNENLDTARMLMYRELSERVKDMSMYDAALEVNHWCHEYVTYRASDGRTSAPLATMLTSLGRCGEESTFTVTAMRSIGIPARQCYTPRWAHCDDNHAWVEVWVDGEWKFLGACEPDAELNMGWFAIPSTRCMMVHTKVYGNYKGDEEVVRRTPLYSELNLLPNYAPTKKVTVTVVDKENNPIKDAQVKFKLYNYSEYYPLASIATDEKGEASLTTGLGDLLIWATDGTAYNYQKIDVRKANTMTIQLTRTMGNEYVEELDIVPPTPGDSVVTPTEEKIALNNQRLAYEDSLRGAYMATFPQKGSYKAVASLTAEQQWDLIHTSEGNYAEVINFINSHATPEENFFLYDYMKSYSDKDLRDTKAETFESHITKYDGKYPVEVYKKGIMPARISNEFIRSWRQPLADSLAPEKLLTATVIKAWVMANITVDPIGNYYNCPISPMGVYKLKYADPHSRDIFYVAACRSLNIPAYLDNATNIIYVYEDNTWSTIIFEEKPAPNTNAKITLNYKGQFPVFPQYYIHYTLEKFVDGDFVTYDFEGDPRVAKIPATLDIEPGYYLLSTGARLQDGIVLSRLEFFKVEPNQHITKDITLRDITLTKHIYGNLDPQMDIYEDMATLEDYASPNGMLFCFLGDYREPSKHLIKEMQAIQKQWKAWGGMTYLVAPEEAKAISWNLVNTDCVTGTPNDEMEQKILKALKIHDLRNNYPLVALVNPKGDIIFYSEGYRIGLAEMILNHTVNKTK